MERSIARVLFVVVAVAIVALATKFGYDVVRRTLQQQEEALDRLTGAQAGVMVCSGARCAAALRIRAGGLHRPSIDDELFT